MKLTCIIIEDEVFAQNILESHILKIPSLDLLAKCKDVASAEFWLKNKSVDLIFLDINLPVISGVDFVVSLKKRQEKFFKVLQPYIVFTTGYPDYASKAYELDVVDYLVKPITFDRFYQSVQKVIRAIHSDLLSKGASLPELVVINEIHDELQYIFVKSGRKIIKINLSEILYIKGLKEYVSFYTKTGRIISYNRMKKIEILLPKNEFIRVHNSYIIAINKIQKLSKNKIMINENQIPVSKKYQALIEKTRMI